MRMPPRAQRRTVPGESFSLLEVPGFAPGFAHAFVARGEDSFAPLFKPGPVPRDAILRAMGLGGGALHLARQVHGGRAAEFPTQTGLEEHCDALVTRQAGHVVGVATADCLPILLADAQGACAAVHAGWRGLLAGVIEHAVEAVLDASEDLHGHRLEATIGPAIGSCCFEVGPEVAGAYLDRFGTGEPRIVIPVPDTDRSIIDLPGAAERVLETAGVAATRIHRTDLCTRCGEPWLESYRRDGARAGRLIAVIGRA